MGHMDFDMAKNIIDEIDQMKIRGITIAVEVNHFYTRI